MSAMDAEELSRLLDELGRRIGPTGEYVWQLAIRQVVIDSIAGMIFGTILLAVSAVTVVMTRRYVVKHADDHYFDAMFAWFFSGILWVSAGGFGLMLVGINITRLLNPEYSALRDLLERIIP